MEDFYKVLGLSHNATREEIVSAYRKIALKTHPDKSPSDDELFKKATEAYTILRDDESRLKYDRKLNRSVKPVGLYGKDIRVTLEVSLEDIINGAVKTIITTRKGICSLCNGTGSKSNKTSKCHACNGSGINPISLVIGNRIICETCNGVGCMPYGEKCSYCSGTGLVDEEIHRNIQLNHFLPGSIVINSSGHCHPNGKPGNLIVEVFIKKDPVYELRGLNIYRCLEISPAQAVLGDTVEIYLFNHTLSIKVPPGTQHDSIIEVKNEGISCEHKKGSLIIRVKIVTPKFISKETRALYEQILNLEGKEGVIHG